MKTTLLRRVLELYRIRNDQWRFIIIICSQYWAKPLSKFIRQTTPRTVVAIRRTMDATVKQARYGHCTKLLFVNLKSSRSDFLIDAGS